MGSVGLVEDENKELVGDVHRLSRLGVQLGDSNKGGVMVDNGFQNIAITHSLENWSDIEATTFGTSTMFHG
ncbi:hypothetical protein MTR67_011991 [Solanum verrucosum]|uniref:Uncharacterized protein n=1 Tax=Solanum verrucosum TaxID=315347 RepID=A0AAF0TGL3_SOLVR|nr:hypothetical protein MTR67_011991 [Solanum verrucosum]